MIGCRDCIPPGKAEVYTRSRYKAGMSVVGRIVEPGVAERRAGRMGFDTVMWALLGGSGE